MQEIQYAKWLAASRLAAKGKTMADSGYDAEVKSIMAFLSMQHPASQPAINPATLDINIEDYVAPRFLRKMRSKVSHCLFSLFCFFAQFCQMTFRILVVVSCCQTSR